jgi:hypothetical protein
LTGDTSTQAAHKAREFWQGAATLFKAHGHHSRQNSRKPLVRQWASDWLASVSGVVAAHAVAAWTRARIREPENRSHPIALIFSFAATTRRERGHSPLEFTTGACPMSVQSKISQWRHVGRFCARRVSTKSRLLNEVVALVALAVGALFTLSFLCIAIIATAIGTPYFLAVVWGVAGTWAVVTVAASFVVRTRHPAQPFRTFQLELQRDLQVIKEATR